MLLTVKKLVFAKRENTYSFQFISRPTSVSGYYISDLESPGFFERLIYEDAGDEGQDFLKRQEDKKHILDFLATSIEALLCLEEKRPSREEINEVYNRRVPV